MAGVSPDLVWLLLRKQNKYLHKQGGDSNASVTFTSEPLNLTARHAFKHCGLANKKAVALDAGSEGFQVVLTTKKTKKGQNPVDILNKSVLKKNFRKMALAIESQIVSNGYRPDLKVAALARLSAIHKSLRTTKAGPKKPKAKRVLKKSA